MSKVNVALGAVLGAVAGFVTGILVAPKSGKETRDDIKNGAVKAKDVTFEKAGEVKDKASQVASDVAAKAKGVVGDVEAKGVELKGRVEQAVDGAQKGFAKKPKNAKK
ncbi:MAG: YtxH domain-containing protein [Candidatus Microsaccharimonas sp.]